MDVSFTNSRASIASARRADTDWATLTTQQRIRSIELDGYVVIPDLLWADQLDRIRGELPPEVCPFFRSLNTRQIAACQDVRQVSGADPKHPRIAAVITKQASYPVERTLLVTGMLAAAIDSRFE